MEFKEHASRYSLRENVASERHGTTFKGLPPAEICLAGSLLIGLWVLKEVVGCELFVLVASEVGLDHQVTLESEAAKLTYKSALNPKFTV